MISHFFIDRPIFASVMSIVLVIAGAVSVFSLPIEQYPPITPPTVQVSVLYPGASAEVVSDTIAAPIEQQVNGVEKMIYMSSTSDNTGSYNLTVTFEVGTNLNIALVAVQNRVNLALPQLPNSVQKQGLTIKKKSPSILLTINLYCDKMEADGKPRYDTIYLSNYATIHLKDELFRLDGVGDILYLGQRDYSIRAWLDPQKLASRAISASQVVDALRAQNLAVATGQVGSPPSKTGQSFQIPITLRGRLVTTDEFGDIIVRTVPSEKKGTASQLVRLKDVARIELGASRYDLSSTVDGQPSVTLAIFQLPGSNALDVAESIKKKLDELERHFPEGVKYLVAYDTTPFIRESVMDVLLTLIDAIILVGLVVLIFLQSWRATIIPLIAVPVAVVGTFAAMALLGFSINNISLFGLVLAIGIVVDDAIVVVENVERLLDQGLSPKEAARKAMGEVTGPVIAVALVLCAVFVPCAFISGITGQFFKQFAVTIAVSTVISAFNSLTLSPALAAILLKHREHGKFDYFTCGLFIVLIALVPSYLRLSHHLGEGWPWFIFLPVTAVIVGGLGGAAYLVFNRAFDMGTAVYSSLVGMTVRVSVLVLVGYVGLLYLTYWSYDKTPKGFIPSQDQGFLLVNIQLPDGASLQRTEQVLAEVEQIARDTPGVAHTTGVAGFTFLLNVYGSNYGGMFVVLEPFDERRDREKSAEVILAKLQMAYRKKVREAIVSVFGAPPVQGLGTAGGFKVMVEDRGDLGSAALDANTRKLIVAGMQQKEMAGLFTMYSAGSPQLFADIDRVKARSLQVPIQSINETLNAFIGSQYVNNYNQFGRFWQVNVMAEGSFRTRRDALGQIYVPNTKGRMVPLSTIVDMRDTIGPGMVLRYNLYRSAPLNGAPLPGVSSGKAIQDMSALSVKVLPRSMKTEWTELSYLQIQESQDWRNRIVFPLAVVLVFMVLAALYESWSLPLAVILVVPMCILCSVAGVAIMSMDINIFTQIGLVVLVGLASKNAILIVEFARQLQTEGKPLFEATTEASRLRLRPILMTSFAFILGVVPLVIAKGAGAEMRRALGTAVFSGMLGVTAFGIFLTPVFFFVIQWLGDRPELQTPAAKRAGNVLYYIVAGLTLGLVPILGALFRGLRPGSTPPNQSEAKP